MLARRTLAWRFAYMVMFRYMLPFPLVAQRDFSTAGLSYSALEALQPGRCPSLDHAVSVLLDGTPVCPAPTPRADAVNDEAEYHAATVGLPA
jgi:hypothetical protein